VSRSTSAVYGSQTNHQVCLPKPRGRQALVHRHAAAAHRAALQHTLPAGQACGEKSRLVHDRNQMAKLAVDVFGPGDCVCDFCSQEFSETLAEPVHRHFHAPFGQVQMCGNLSLRSGAFVAPNGTLQFLENLGFVRGTVFSTQRGQDVLDQGDRPALLIGGVRIGFVGRFRCITVLGDVRVDGKKRQIATTL